MSLPTLASLHRDHVADLCQRYDSALAAAGFDAIVLFAGTPYTVFADDRALPFAALPHFESWLPLNAHPWCSIVYRPGDTPRLAYFQPDDYWEMPPADPGGFWAAQFDIDVFRKADDARRTWPAAGRVAVLADPRCDLEMEDAGTLNPQKLAYRLDLGRTKKTGYELACLREATELSVHGHRAAAAAFEDGASEYEIHQRYLAACGHTDDELPYHSIVALNTHGAVLHYGGRDRKAPAERHALLIDAGARFSGYASDITRTYAADASRFSELIAGLDAIQQATCASLRPGVDYREANESVHAGVASLLAEFGLLTVDADVALEDGITRTFLPHGLGHFLGVQVHDVAGQTDDDGAAIPPPDNHPFLRLTRKLEAGNVLTVEPGIYFIDTLLAKLKDRPEGRGVNWGALEDWRRYGGVRIEDNVHVTDDGVENLTRAAFASGVAPN